MILSSWCYSQWCLNGSMNKNFMRVRGPPSVSVTSTGPKMEIEPPPISLSELYVPLLLIDQLYSLTKDCGRTVKLTAKNFFIKQHFF